MLSQRAKILFKALDPLTRSFSSSTFYRKDLTFTPNNNPKPLPTFDSTLKFGHNSTDHLFEVDWSLEEGWETPKIGPYQKFNLDPLNTVFHYAIQCLDGLKAFRGVDGKIRLFRPEKNMQRFNVSCQRISLPRFDENELLECLKEFVRVEKRWVPNAPNFSLYIRPTAISMNDALGVKAPNKSKLYLVATPVGPYFPKGFKPIRLFADKDNVRAYPGGSGEFKLGSNYGPTITISREAEKKGFQQVLWLTEGRITEVGASNIFFFWVNEQGEKELITAPLDGLSLPGVTRDSVLDLARQMKGFKVSEKYLMIDQFVKAVKEKRMIEAFGAGTAMTIAPVELIHYDGVDYQIPVEQKTQMGELAKVLYDKIHGIQYGTISHPWAPIVA